MRKKMFFFRRRRFLLLLSITILCILVARVESVGREENLTTTIYKFIYNNEDICGDMFADEDWLPAQQNCELKCRMDAEVCQVSSSKVAIQRQRCFQLPEECSLQLKDIVIGDEVFTTPTKSNPMLAGQKTREAATKHPNSQMLAGPSYSSPTGAARSSSKIVERDPGDISKSSPELLPLSGDDIVIAPSRLKSQHPPPATLPTLAARPQQQQKQSLRANSTSPRSTTTPKTQTTTRFDLNTLLDLLQSSSENGSGSEEEEDFSEGRPPMGDIRPNYPEKMKKNKKKGGKSSVIRIDDSNSVASSASSDEADETTERSSVKQNTTTKITSSPAFKTRPSPGTTPTSTKTSTTTASRSTKTTVKPTTTVNANTTVVTSVAKTTASVAEEEMKSIEMNQLFGFTNNPFSAQSATLLEGNTKGAREGGEGAGRPNSALGSTSPRTTPLAHSSSSSSSSYSSSHIRPIETTTTTMSNNNKHLMNGGNETVDFFGPPMNPSSGMAAGSNKIMIRPLATGSSAAPPSPNGTTTATLVEQPVSHGNLSAAESSSSFLGTGGGNPSSFQNERGGDGEERRRLEDAGVLNSVRSMDALETKERHPALWSWKELANKMKQRPLFSMSGHELTTDQSVHCCQWAMEGLCDRSWQRLRELCPKSCGTLVCSSIDGTLSCNRAIDVDVIDCFEKRKQHARAYFQRVLSSPPLMTPALEAPGTDSIEPINSNQQEDEQEEAPPPSNTEKQHSMEQRAFAVEKEIRFLNSMNKRKYYPVPKS